MRGFKIILLIMTTVWAVDLIAATWLMRSWPPAALLALDVVAIYLLARSLRGRKAAAPSTGWKLGPALELTNPDRPERIPAAVIAPKVLNLGLLFIGGPGAGKTESATLGYIKSMRDYSPNGGWAYFEGKGDIDIYKKCVAMGSAPTHFFSTELPGSDTINLFAGEAQDVIDRLGRVLIGETASTSYYSDEQRAVLSRVVPLLRCLRVPTNLRDLYVALAVQDAGNELLRHAADAGAAPVDLELAKAWFMQPMKDRIKNISGLLNRLFVFVNGPYADRLNAYQPDIDIEAAVAASESIYLHLPLTTFARDVAVAIIETFGVVARKRQLGGTENLASYPLLFDDWGAFFHAGFGPFSARCRSAAMPLSFGFQSRAQLAAVSHTFADELDDTIATKIILRVMGGETAMFAIRLLGEFEQYDVSTTAGATRDDTGMRAGRIARIERREVLELQPGEAFVSTLQQTPEGMKNPLWKLRLPLPEFPNWQQVPMPPARQHPEGEGLGFWNRYMNPARLAEIHASVHEAVASHDAAQVQVNAQVQISAMADLAKNPGFVNVG